MTSRDDLKGSSKPGTSKESAKGATGKPGEQEEDSLDFTMGSKVFTAPDETLLKTLLAEEEGAGKKVDAGERSKPKPKDEGAMQQPQSSLNGPLSSSAGSAVSSSLGTSYISSLPSTTLSSATSYLGRGTGQAGLGAKGGKGANSSKTSNPYDNPYFVPKTGAAQSKPSSSDGAGGRVSYTASTISAVSTRGPPASGLAPTSGGAPKGNRNTRSGSKGSLSSGKSAQQPSKQKSLPTKTTGKGSK